MSFTRQVLISMLLLCGLALDVRAQAVPELSPSTAPAPTYIQSGDNLQISVWPDTELSGVFPVEESGLMYLPLIGVVAAAGKSLETLVAELRVAYGELIQNAVVTAIPLFKVSVLGEVQRPGLYRVEPSQSLFDVLSLAGGFSDEADLDEVRVIRRGSIYRVNAKQALETGEALLAVSLTSGDRIVVPKNRPFLGGSQNIFYIVNSLALIATIIQLNR